LWWWWWRSQRETRKVSLMCKDRKWGKVLTTWVMSIGFFPLVGN
jgi:hypothetical protein